VISLLGRYFYNIYIVKMVEIVFSLLLRTIIYFHVYIILDFPITYRNASVFFQSECACLLKTVNMIVMKIPTQKGEHLCKCTELFL